VAKYPSVRIAITYILAMGGKIELGDVPNAFLNSDVDTEVYMEHPEGYSTGKRTVCKLLKGLYGLKQAAMLWHTDIDRFLSETLNFRRLPDDRCIYMKRMEASFVIVILYVDDIAVGSNSTAEIDQLFRNLYDRFMIKRLGPIDHSIYLGMLLSISDSRDSITMSQPHAITKLLTKMNMESCRPVSTPQNPKTTLTADSGNPFPNVTQYRSIIGALFWIARTTRPDIMFTVSVLAQYQSAPTDVHYGATIHVIRYLAGTINLGITLRKPNTMKLNGWTDASHNDIQRGAYGTTGFIVAIGECPVAWSSQKQTLRVLSSTAAEYIAASTTLDTTLWISSWIANMNALMGKIFNHLPTLHTDSASCIKMIQNRSVERDQSRFIDLRQLQIMDRYHAGRFIIRWVKGDDNPADILTKTISSAALFTKHRDTLLSFGDVVTGE
jgi:hypothetical protein